MSLRRRDFLRRAAALGGSALFAPSLAGLSTWSRADAALVSALRPRNNGGYGELVQSVDCPELWIPRGFRAVRVSRTGEPSRSGDGFVVPNAVDGMGAFALPNGDVRLVRNHEMVNAPARAAPMGERPYDALASGGTTSLTVRITGSGMAREVSVLDEHVSLGGTHVNCAGGITPWGSWLSCEETTNGPQHGFGKPHGYVFEVPSSSRSAVEPVPLRAMGRFVHEAVAVDPRTSVVYLTEDMRREWANLLLTPGAGFYRFVPATPGRLADGGRLQILAVRDSQNHDTITGATVGEWLDTYWLDIEEPDPAAAETDPSAVFREGLAKGAAIFQRLEGCFWADDSCYFVSTSGGDARAGQVWRFIPEGDDGGRLTLVFESPSRDILDGPDNLCTTRRGGLVICEDSGGAQFVRGLSKDGMMVDLAMQPRDEGDPQPTEFAGCCFDGTGEVLFFNVQGARLSYGTVQGSSYALWGDWSAGPL